MISIVASGTVGAQGFYTTVRRIECPAVIKAVSRTIPSIVAMDKFFSSVPTETRPSAVVIVTVRYIRTN